MILAGDYRTAPIRISKHGRERFFAELRGRHAGVFLKQLAKIIDVRNACQDSHFSEVPSRLPGEHFLGKTDSAQRNVLREAQSALCVK